MEKSTASRLSEDELRRLSLDVLREWWLTATQTLVDAAGSEKALELLRPYFVHMGRAGGINIRTLTKGATVGRPTGTWIQRCGVGGKPGLTYIAGDGTIIEELIECETRGKNREACICLCSYCMSAGAEETNPKYDYVLISSLSSGDPECRWLTKWKDRPPLVAPTEEFVTHEFDLLPEELTDELAEYFGLSVIGESVMNCTRASIDFLGPDETKERLSGHMRRSGISFAKRVASGPEPSKMDMAAIMDMIGLLNNMHQREGSLSASQERAEGTIIKCPFSDAPFEFCLQHESFCNGICEATNPEFYFAYDRMMTKGEKTCHWTIRKKREQGKDKAKGETPSDDPAKILAIRYAKGEITKEELEERMENLRKLGLVE